MRIIDYIKKPKLLYFALARRNILKVSDKKYIQMLYKMKMKKNLDLENPKSFNEKLQWLKLYDRKPEYVKMVDKYEVKKYIAKTIGSEYVIPTIGVYNKFEEINFSKLPNRFVIKCTHDSGGNVICRNKENLNYKEARKKINKSLKYNFYYNTREWPYKNVKPRIIVEEYLEDKDSVSIRDYKFFCFDGKMEFLYLSEGLENHSTAKISFLDKNFAILPFKRADYKNFDRLPNKPVNFDKMIELSEKLSKGIPHLRVDFYEVNGKIYFGELTFYTCSGFIPFEPIEWDDKLGNLITIDKDLLIKR